MAANYCQNCGSRLTGPNCQNCNISDAELEPKPLILSESYSSNSKVSSGRIMFWTIIGGVCFIFFWLNKSLDDKIAKNAQMTVYGNALLGDGENSSPNKGQSRIKQQAKSALPQKKTGQKARRGDVIVLKEGTPCMFTKEGLDDVERWHSRGDNREAATALVRHGGMLLDAGDSVKVMDPGIIRTEVRSEGSLNSCFVLRERLVK